MFSYTIASSDAAFIFIYFSIKTGEQLLFIINQLFNVDVELFGKSLILFSDTVNRSVHEKFDRKCPTYPDNWL